MQTAVSIYHVLRSLALAMILLSCQQKTSDDRLRGAELSPPLFGDAMQPFLFAGENELYMSWTEVDEQGISNLMMSSFADGAWGERIELANGKDWFVNWADFPAVSKNGKALVSHFLKKSDTATFSYDVFYLQSKDDGRNWSEPFKMHSDTVRAEHGFVSFAPDGPDSFMAVWLDGRDTSTEEELESSGTHDGHGGKGAMQLQSARIDSIGRISREKLIDERTCDCCQTSLVRTSAGTLVAYRDRSDNEIRDIYVSLLQDGSWSAPRPVYRDNWKIAGCPVNGPKLAAHDNVVSLAWFTAANDRPEVKVAFSKDGGMSFDPPIRIDEGLPMGRVDAVLLDENTAVISWMESVGNQARIRLTVVDSSSGKIASWEVAEVPGSRATGFPQLEKFGDQIFMAWNDREGKKKKIKVIRLDLEGIYP